MDASAMTHAHGDAKDFRLLILAPHGRDAALAEQALLRSGLLPETCADFEALRREIKVGAGAVLIAEEAIPVYDVREPKALFGDEPPWSSLPIIVLLRNSSSYRHFRALRSLERRPNITFLERPVPRRTFVSTLHAALEARRLQYDIRDALDAAKAASRKKDEFLATLAHELRNPLAPIRNAVYVLRERNRDDPASDKNLKAHALISMVGRQVDHLVRLVDDLLEVSRITTGKVTLRKEHVALATCINEAVAISQPLIETQQHELIISLGDQRLAVHGDPVRLAQVFANLMNNSAKYTPPGGRIEVSMRQEGGQAVVSVRDNGMGILMGMLPQVFDLFSQSYRARGRDQGGLGIGLALVRSLVEMHGGRVEAHSDGAGQGSEFVVFLPLVASALERSEAEPVALNAQALGRVLVVDDEKDIADSLAMLLETLGAEVCVAYAGMEAVSATARFRPRVAFIDIGMPIMDGCETARRIRSLNDGKDVVLVALSGWGSKDDRRGTQRAGFDHHFVKPISLETLRSIFPRPAG
ncbi:MAG: hybrid sensor histidine kinase/response regulator [Methylocystis sp.]|uniref:hybrid sensor histidine kinase/response regulator n=1 Tax=Methylocystis sp. TaxID=1911079 RepID=UPI003DA525A2